MYVEEAGAGSSPSLLATDTLSADHHHDHHPLDSRSASHRSTSTAMPKTPALRVLQSGGDIQVINVHFETHNDAHVLIKLLGFCAIIILLLVTVFVFFGSGTALDAGSSFASSSNSSQSSVSRVIFANYRGIVAAVWLIWYGVFCFWCWFARLAWGDVTVPEKCVVGFRRVRERSVICWLPNDGTSAASGRWQLRVARPVSRR
ncbi:hypothetical protein THASP1DRAFT_28962 [Thamnocephalis sphaerospora]|uniref:Uncharacterized protein n=1 Tax=Thamnocephalis sphaerospora TaxID=78915 RepID=A0A4P9XT01_9FUNG|nr:hypothetical protein THASP1DRAFT_28962 [Thamnocephalis sphaerospora]|eukprot:RKP09256.1 hypothetical protein THASP1DRAFT_28962 [Thamnocephalis sphaerospora]